MEEKDEKRKDKKMGAANHSIMKLTATHCYRCGVVFSYNSDNDRRTDHHAIPQFLKPQRNVLIPICAKCHRELNRYNVQSLPNFKALENFVKSIKLVADKYENKLQVFKDEK